MDEKKTTDVDRREYPRVNKQEQREYARVVIRLETEVLSGSDIQISGWTRDLSVKGVFVLCTSRLPVGARCRCRLAIGDTLKDSPMIEVSGWIVRCDEQGVAIQFVDYAVECFNELKKFFWKV